MKPYAKAMTIRYVGLQDRRRKLTNEQRAAIVELHDVQGLGCRTIAKMFGVSRSLVRVICVPGVAERIKKRTSENWRKYRELRGKAENARIMRVFRKRKYECFIRGELIEKPQRSKKDDRDRKED